jgi:serine/threonine protein kinase
MREAQILGLFDHPHIVKIRYFVRTLDNWLLYFEDAGSITLSQYIHRYGSTSPQAQYHERMDPIKWDRLVHRFAQQIGSALRYCHLNCVHHSSLRSDKIVVSRAGDVKITGFGSYRLVEEHWGQCFDTFCYGTILWHMMCGSVLWPMTDSWDRYSCVVQFELVKPEHIPPRTSSAVQPTEAR